MAELPPDAPIPGVSGGIDPVLRHTAADVTRGLARWFHRARQVVLIEVPLPNGRRADVVAIDPKGKISIVEVKVARGDLLGDTKWPDYLEWCDRFYWALAADLDPTPLDDPIRRPDLCGRFIADRYDAVLEREAVETPLPPARRRSETLRLARLAAWRSMVTVDPELLGDLHGYDFAR
jgi:hypothetical protein